MFAQEEKSSFSLSEEEARKFISLSFKNPTEMLAELDRTKEQSALKRGDFIRAVNADPRLLDSFINNPLGTLKEYNILDTVSSVTIDYQWDLSIVSPPYRLCLEEVCVDSKFEMVCIESIPVEVGGFDWSVCIKYVPIFRCSQWKLIIKACDDTQ